MHGQTYRIFVFEKWMMTIEIVRKMANIKICLLSAEVV